MLAACCCTCSCSSVTGTASCWPGLCDEGFDGLTAGAVSASWWLQTTLVLAAGQTKFAMVWCRSAVDIVKIASETIEGLFSMRLALPVALVRALTEGLDEVLRK